MANDRLLSICLALSVLLHAGALFLASLLPSRVPQAPGVMVMELADIPRATVFLPPRAGVIQGARPPFTPSRQEKHRALPRAAKTPPLSRALEGKVPDLPVDPNLPPEKEFPAAAGDARTAPPSKTGEPSTPAVSEELLKTARLESRADFGKAPRQDGGRGGKEAAAPSTKELTPSLGKAVMALASRSGRGAGSEAATGSAVGTGGAAREKGPIAEEGGRGTRLTPLNAPEIQYISYFAGIKRKIELVWQYPYEAQLQGIQGELTIDFAIGRSGTLQAIELVRGSGFRILDDEALRAIRTAAPFDPIPPQYRIPDLRIRAHFTYEMHALRIR